MSSDSLKTSTNPVEEHPEEAIQSHKRSESGSAIPIQPVTASKNIISIKLTEMERSQNDEGKNFDLAHVIDIF